MTISDQATDLRARKQMANTHPATITTSGNGSTKPPLRLVHDSAQTDRPPLDRPASRVPSTSHTAGIEDAVIDHVVIATHPPTLVEAALNLWPARTEVRHGFAGQFAAAIAGVVQLVGLAACWAIAHLCFATKTRAAIFVLVITCGLAIYASAIHA